MLKKKVTELIDRYESGDEGWLTAEDVQEELETILEEEDYDDELSPKLYDALDEYALARYHASRGGGRIPDGSDEFIEKVEEIIGYE